MKYPPYPRYRDSGVDWLGSMPEHWHLKRFGFLLERGYEGMKIGPFGSQLKSDMLVEQGFKVYGQENVINNDFAIGQRFVNEQKFNELRVYEVKAGDLLITMMGSSGNCQIVPTEFAQGIMDSHLIRLRTRSTVVSRRFVRLLIDEGPYVKYQMLLSGKGSIMHGLNSSIIGNLFFLLPSIEEQGLILRFLDSEIAKINALIGKQERLIELLREKRQSIISHAVTKGLNPQAPRKDSGIEWLGEIPAHWELWRLKHLIKFITSGSRGWAEYYSDEGDIFIRIGNLTRESIKVDLSDVQYVSIPKGVEGERTRISTGDLLISITAYLGSVAVAPKIVEGAYVSQHVALARPNKKIATPKWLGYSILSDACKTQFDLAGYGGTKIQLSLDDVKELTLLRPPLLDEQCAIISYIESELSKVDSLVDKASRAIELLKEHRMALISNAVTGKIDVQQYANQTQMS